MELDLSSSFKLGSSVRMCQAVADLAQVEELGAEQVRFALRRTGTSIRQLPVAGEDRREDVDPKAEPTSGGGWAVEAGPEQGCC